jgi:hypothetical protein
MAADLYEEEKVKGAELAAEELAIREGRLEVSGERPLIDLPSEALEEMATWDPESDPAVIQDFGGGVTLRKRKPRSTARRRLKAEPVGDMPEEEPEQEEAQPPAKPPRERPPRTPPKRAHARIPLGEGLSWIIGLGGTGLQVSGRDPAVGRALAFEAPVAGLKLDQVIAGTMLDRLAQPIARAGKMGADLGAVLALPVLVGLIERRPELYPVLRPVLEPMVVEMFIEVQEAGERAAKRLEAASKRAGGQKIDVDALMAMLFQGIPPSDGEGEGATEPAP